MNIKKHIFAASIMLVGIFNVQAQKKRSITELSKEEIQKLRERRSIQFEASEYTEKCPELGITIMRDTTHQKEFEIFKNTLSKKLNEKGVPHKFFIEVLNDNKGSAFAYFIKGRQHGVFNFKEFVALLPEAVRDFKKAFPKIKSKIHP